MLITSKHTTLHYITQPYATLKLYYTTTAAAASTTMTTTTTLHCATLRQNYNYTTLHYNTLDYTTLYHATVHNTTVHYSTLQYIATHYTNYTTPQLPVALRKAAAEVSKIVNLVFFGVVAMFAVVTSPQLLDVVWCSAAVVVGVVVVVV